MITVLLNDKTVVVDQARLDIAITQWRGKEEICAVAINEIFIPKSCYGETILQEGDRIELLTPAQGG
jgi:sulfur carrier protein